MASSKVALGLLQYSKPIPRPYYREITEQMSEYYGLSHFHCEAHQHLSSSLQSLLSSYKTASNTSKHELAQKELECWANYITSRSASLPDTFKIPEKTHARLHRIWGQMLHREQDTIEFRRMLDFHVKFTEHYSFDVPMDKRSLFEMVHPHAGYMTLMPGGLTFDRLMEFYRVQVLSAYERSLGEELLARQLSCYNYFKVLSGAAGWLDSKRVAEAMIAFRLGGALNLSEFKEKFQWTLQDFEGEFEGMQENEYFVRFAVIRKIFLDYNL